MGDYFEDHKIGQYLRGHREMLGVARSQILGGGYRMSDTDLRHVERAEHPAVKLVEAHHAALMAAYVTDGTTPAVPLARREQWYANAYDAALWQQASEANPRISWWWGVRSDQAPRGAWCHLCRNMIHGYDVGRGMTGRARKAVMAHRLEHIKDLIAADAATKKASST